MMRKRWIFISGAKVHSPKKIVLDSKKHLNRYPKMKTWHNNLWPEHRSRIEKLCEGHNYCIFIKEKYGALDWEDHSKYDDKFDPVPFDLADKIDDICCETVGGLSVIPQ